MKLLFNPLRMLYKKQNTTNECPFCSKYNLSDDKKYEHLIVARTDHSVIMLNMFPYNPGHLLVLPITHTANIADLSKEARIDLFETLLSATQAAKMVIDTQDINTGMNIGKSAGGSVQSHTHIHVVPRFIGDTNFLAVIAETKVITQDLKSMYDLYRNYFDQNQ
ncbi:MAG: HIT domain-containing protein [Candidatus Dependentiae bacterium]|nr:HIT domain-containing protein [Candidatus Dependentiae bacterium]